MKEKANYLLSILHEEHPNELSKLGLDELKALVLELVSIAKGSKTKDGKAFNLNLLHSTTWIKSLQSPEQLVQQIMSLLRQFPEAQSMELALDREFKSQQERLEAIINDINNGRLPTYRYWELLYENLYIEPNESLAILRSARTFLAYAAPKLSNLSKFLDDLSSALGKDQFKLYMATPQLLAGKDEPITIEDLFFKKQSNLNTYELAALDEEKKRALEGYLPGRRKNIINIIRVDTHIASAHRSADESHVEAFRLMVEANPTLGVKAEYSEHGLTDEKLARKVEVKRIGKLGSFVKENLAALRNNIEKLIRAKSKDLYNDYIRANDKDPDYNSLTGEEKSEADKKVDGLLFMANTALRFMSNMIDNHRCDGTHSFSTNVPATCGLTMEEMVATCYWASKDKNNFKQVTSRADILFAIIRQLHDMRRGYDIDYGIDRPEEDVFPNFTGTDSNRCHGGCVNSLASALASIHKAYNVRVITSDDIQREIKAIYKKIAEENVNLLDKDKDQEMLQIWSSTGRVTGKFKESLQDIFETNYRKEFEDNYKGYINDVIFESIIENGLDSVPIPEALKPKSTVKIPKSTVKIMDVENIYASIAKMREVTYNIKDGTLPLLHFDIERGYESTLNYLENCDGLFATPTVAHVTYSILHRNVRTPSMLRALSYLSRSNLGQEDKQVVFYKIENKAITIGEISSLSEDSLKTLLMAAGLERLLEFSIVGWSSDLFNFYAFKIGFTEENLRTKYGDSQYTPLHYAARHGQIDVVRSILEQPCAKELLNIKNIDGIPLHHAFIGDHVEVAKTILETPEGKTYLSVTDGDGNNSLHLAVRHGSIDAVRLILEQPCAKELLSSKNKDGEIPLHYALIRGHVEVTKAILETPEGKTLLSVSNRHGNNSLHLAVRHGSIDAVRLILEQPCAKELLNSKNKDGKTPWQLAFADPYKLEICKELFAVFLVDVKRFLLELTKTSLMVACAGIAIALAIRYTTGPIWTGTAYFKGAEDILGPFVIPSTLTETVTNYFADKLKYHTNISVTDNLIDNLQIF
jgi:hypothetical protein